MKPSKENSEFVFYKLIKPFDSNRWQVILPFYHDNNDYRHYMAVHIFKNYAKESNLRSAVDTIDNYKTLIKFGDINTISSNTKQSLLDIVFNIKIDNNHLPQ